VDRHQRRRAKAEDAYARTLAEVSENEAIRTAEEIVCSAWITELMRSEREASLAVLSCEHMREKVREILCLAQADGEPLPIIEAQTRLETVERVLAECSTASDQARDILAEELEEWAAATQVRIEASLADQDRLSTAMRHMGESEG
jgi:hypothetical protein